MGNLLLKSPWQLFGFPLLPHTLFSKFILANQLLSVWLTVHHVALFKAIIVGRDFCFAQVRLNVVLQVPGLIFIKHHEEERKLASDVSLATAWCQHAPPADRQRPNQTTCCVLQQRRLDKRMDVGWIDRWMDERKEGQREGRIK